MNMHQKALFTSRSFKSSVGGEDPSPCNQQNVVIFVNDVANFDFWVPNLLNLKEFQEFQNILGIQLLQVLLCLWQISPDDSEISDPCLLLQVSLCL